MAEKLKQVTVYGGHDYEVVGKIPDRLICQICTKVLREPHLAVCCGQHFCESCLNKWFDQQRGKQSCPHCRTEGEAFHHVINKGLRSEISQLKIRCSNLGQGCQWTGEQGTLRAHLESESGCGFVMVECPNKCLNFLGDATNTMLRKEIKNHLAHNCYLRPYQCEFCGLNDTYEAITGGDYITSLIIDRDLSGHQATCPEAPLTCPNECGSENIKRKDMDGHRSKCPQEPVECPFAEAGCDGILLRCQLEDHMTSSIQQHLMIVMKDNKETKSKLKETREALETELKETQIKLTDTQAKLNEAQVEIETVKKELGHQNEAFSRLSLAEQCIGLSYKLEKQGDSIKILMPDFPRYSHVGNVWRSPPFYYREGYKMCLAVYANGVGKGAGTHVSLSLLLLKGKYDDQLKWPMMFCNKTFHYSMIGDNEGCEEFIVCSGKRHQLVKDHEKIGHCDRFCSLTSNALELVNNSLALSVQFSDECCLQINIIKSLAIN